MKFVFKTIHISFSLQGVSLPNSLHPSYSMHGQQGEQIPTVLLWMFNHLFDVVKNISHLSTYTDTDSFFRLESLKFREQMMG